MGGNPKESEWRSTPREKRRRKPLTLTLSPAALVMLDALIERWKCSRSQAVERLIRERSDE